LPHGSSPYRGSWLDFEFDAKDIIHVRIDRRRKLPATTLLFALGMRHEEILDEFYARVNYVYDAKRDAWKVPLNAERLRGQKATRDMINTKSGRVAIEAGTKITGRLLSKLEAAGVNELLVPSEELIGRYMGVDLVDDSTGRIYVEAGEELTEELIAHSSKQASLSCRRSTSI